MTKDVLKNRWLGFKGYFSHLLWCNGSTYGCQPYSLGPIPSRRGLCKPVVDLATLNRDTRVRFPAKVAIVAQWKSSRFLFGQMQVRILSAAWDHRIMDKYTWFGTKKSGFDSRWSPFFFINLIINYYNKIIFWSNAFKQNHSKLTKEFVF